MSIKNYNLLIIILVIISIIFISITGVYANENINIKFSLIDREGNNLIDGRYEIEEQESVMDISKRLFDENLIPYEITNDEISAINGEYIDENKQWIYVINGEEMGSLGATDYYLEDGDYLEWIHIEIHKEKNVDKKLSPYINGYNDGTFRPQNKLTREEAASVLFNILDEDMKIALKTDEHNFNDIVEGKWSEEAIATLNSFEIMDGYKDGSFKPGENITRGEVAVILARMNNLFEDDDAGFLDIKDYWGEKEINMVANKGWIEGYGDDTFRPFEKITRAEFVTIINKVLGRDHTSEDIEYINNNFNDIDQNRWFYLEVLKASNEYLVNL